MLFIWKDYKYYLCMENEGVLVISLDKLFEGTFGGKKQDIVIILNNWKNLYVIVRTILMDD